ncbi:hypothetical protein ACH5RR_018506, partial [Cinchona calisaya]
TPMQVNFSEKIPSTFLTGTHWKHTLNWCCKCSPVDGYKLVKLLCTTLFLNQVNMEL